MTSNAEIAKAVFLAYVEDDRDAIEALIAEDFRFTSPYDNGLDRKTYFTRCWPNHEMLAEMKFVRAIDSGDEAVITYEGKTKGGKVFRNTEVLTIRGGKLRKAEVYFGWNLPHAAPEGGFVDNPEAEEL